MKWTRQCEATCEGLPGVYSNIWCLCYKTNELKKKEGKRGRQAGLNRPEKGAAGGIGSCDVTSGLAGGSSGRQLVILDDDFNSAMSTETPRAYDLVLGGLPASSREPTEQ